MNYKWYFARRNKSNQMSTTTENVTLNDLSKSFNVSNIAPDSLVYSVKAYTITNGVKEEIRVSSESSVTDNQTIINVWWETAFVGVIELTTWKK